MIWAIMSRLNAGVVIVISVSLMIVKLAAAILPIITLVTSAKPTPESVIIVPPALPASAGEALLIVGGGVNVFVSLSLNPGNCWSKLTLKPRNKYGKKIIYIITN